MQIISVSVLLASMALPATMAQSKPGFAGTWKVDAAQSTGVGGGTGQRDNAGGGRGGGLGLGPSPERLVISEDATSVTIDEHRGAAVARIVLAFDGKPVARAIAAGRSAGATASTVSKWEKTRLTTTVAMPGNPAVEYEEVRYLDLGSLVVEIRQIGAPNMRRVVYVRDK